MTVNQSRTRASLGDALVQMQIITAEQLADAQKTRQDHGGKLSEILVSKGSIRVDELATFLSIMWNIPLIDLKTHVIQPEALALVPEEMARQHIIIPLNIIGDTLVVVMADPDDYIAINDLFTRTNMQIQVAFANAVDIRRAIDIYYRSGAEIQEKVKELMPPPSGELSPPVEFTAETPITESLDLLIQQAVRDRASDIHLEPQAGRLRVRCRIDGILQDAGALPRRAHPELVSRIKILAEMDVTRSRQPQDGQFSVKVGDKDIDIRVATTDTIYGERITLRLLDKSLSLFTLPELGMLPDTLKRYRNLLASPYGMILVGGPTGSGKTTTLYTSINEIDRNKNNIMTIEDPVEYQFEGISQSQVDPKVGVTFAGGLKAMLRQDPDVILVGEIRDKETAATAVQAALTGHLVFSSIHANDTAGMLSRLIDLGVEPALISSTLLALVSQRMVRRVCTNCRATLAPTALEQSIYRRETGHELSMVYKGSGCHLCASTGYRGRVGVFEMLPITGGMQQKLMSYNGPGGLREQAAGDGICSMKRDGLQKVKEGITTFEELMAGVYAPGGVL